MTFFPMQQNEIASNIEWARERIERAAIRSGRSAEAVTLIAAGKAQPVESIMAACEAGLSHFGENRVQEAISKFAEHKETGGEGVPREGITLHLIGSLQRNKTRAAARHFDCIQSVDRISLVQTLDAAVREAGGTPMPVLLEVNLTGEASKAGVQPADLPRLAESLAGCAHLHGVGLMTIARLGAGAGELHETFAALRRLLDELRSRQPGDWRHLSMGMSDDFETAIEEGATMVRLGRALFGQRPG